MKVALVPAVLCTLLVLASAVPIDQFIESDINENTNDFIAEHILDNLVVTHGGGDADVDASDVPEKDRTVDDDKSDKNHDSGNTVEDVSDIPADDRVTDDGKDAVIDDTDQPSNDDDTSPNREIPITVRVAAKDDNENENVTEDNVSETERQETYHTQPPRKRYVKQSTGEHRHRTEDKPRKTITIPVTKTDPTPTTLSNVGSDSKNRGNQGRDPTRGKTSTPSTTVLDRATPSNVGNGSANQGNQGRKPAGGKTATPPTKPPQKKSTTSKSNPPKQKTSSSATKPPSSTTSQKKSSSRPKTQTTRKPTTTASTGVTEENTCRCRVISKPKMQCYTFTNLRKRTCKLRMCGAQWECLKNGTSNNICIRKFASEKVVLVAGTHTCRLIKHAPKAYWVFYRKYTGSGGE